MIIRSDNANRYTNEAAHTDENVRENMYQFFLITWKKEKKLTALYSTSRQNQRQPL